MDYDAYPIAEIYDRARALLPVTALLWQELLADYIDPGAPPPILDLGCGTGRFSKAEVCLAVISGLMDEAPWLAGNSISSADLNAALMFAVFRLAPEGQRLLDAQAGLRPWWERISTRPSFVRTQVPPRHE